MTNNRTLALEPEIRHCHDVHCAASKTTACISCGEAARIATEAEVVLASVHHNRSADDLVGFAEGHEAVGQDVAFDVSVLVYFDVAKVAHMPDRRVLGTVRLRMRVEVSSS